MSSTPFSDRHIGPSIDGAAKMLATLGVDSVEELIDQTVPDAIRQQTPLGLAEGLSEAEALAELRRLANENEEFVSLLGLGYHNTVTPPVIRRNLFENPAWYTAYTPYQPEISQGRLEALLNFQTLVMDLTGLDLANSSMLDEPTAAAEAMTLLQRVNKKNKSAVFVVDSECHPQVINVVTTRAVPLGIDVDVRDVSDGLPEEAFGVLVAQFGTTGVVRDLSPIVESANEIGALTAVTTDLLGLTLVEGPGAAGADVAVGSAQRFGVPLGFGGPHAGFIATSETHKRSLPGRLVGVSKDAEGRPALRLALQTREQHIRREKATSNICTAQVLLAVVASMYAVYHGPEGLTRIATDVASKASRLASAVAAAGHVVVHDAFFDTVAVRVSGQAADVVAVANKAGINLRAVDEQTVIVAFDETSTEQILADVAACFGATVESGFATAVPQALARTSEFCTHEVFHSHRSETQMMRYLRKLSDRDIALDRAMIPLGSCTMKLNAAAEMEPVSYGGFANIHPFAPAEQTAGYRQLIAELEADLAEITGYDAVSIQPNAGSQGELAGLLAIAGYHQSRGDDHRNVCLIPASAHGTNAASAVMAGMRVVVVNTADNGEIDADDLTAKIAEHRDNLAAIMVTYPSTHGVFEAGIADLCKQIHEAGGQVYVDGANLNAMVGLAQPGKFGGDVSHLNLHKTFCIPHGGGGPGVGPIACRSHLAPFLPGHPLCDELPNDAAISGAPYGSAGILPISWAYIKMMGAKGLLEATETAILSANYIAARLDPHFPVLYRGDNGRVGHECIVDVRPITQATGVTVDDVAKRLIDFGFHAPTMSFPVAGTLMIEPTESEDRAEIDRFCDAMIEIKAEIDAVAAGTWDLEESPLRMAPHTAADVATDDWGRSYSRDQGAFPGGRSKVDRYWPPVSRIDGAYGDKNLVCACIPVDAYRDDE